MGDLVAFLRARLDEDERLAEAATHAGLGIDIGPDDRVISSHPDVQDHIATWHPARVLREVEAKRRILDEHSDNGHGYCLGCGFDNQEEHRSTVDQCPTTRALALPHADHADYPGWDPASEVVTE